MQVYNIIVRIFCTFSEGSSGGGQYSRVPFNYNVDTFLLSLLKSEEKLALICYNKSKLTANLFKACNVTDYMLEKCVIRDVINEKEFSNIIKDQGHYNITNARNELIKIAENTVKDYRIGAFC